MDAGAFIVTGVTGACAGRAIDDGDEETGM